MAIRYLVDTNIVSELMRPRPRPTVYTRWHAHTSDIAIASVTWHELLTGVERMPLSRRRTAFEVFLQTAVRNLIPILSYDTAAAEHHAAERARLTKDGRPPAFADGQIAAIAVVHSLTLVTRNTSDFTSFVDLEVENWFEGE